VFSQATFHGGTDVNDGLSAADGVIDGIGIAEIADGDFGAFQDAFRGAADEKADAFAFGVEAADDFAAQAAGGAGNQDGNLLGEDERFQAALVLAIGGACDLLSPADNANGIGDRNGNGQSAVQCVIERGDQILQTMVRAYFAADEFADAKRHFEERADGIGKGVDDAFRRLGDGQGCAAGVEHEKQIDPEDALGALDNHLALKRLDVPGELELAHAIAAAHLGTPFVEGEVGIAAEALIVAVDMFDGAEERFEEVQGMDGQVAEGITSGTVLRRQWPPHVRRINGTAEDIDGDDPAELTLADQLQGAADLGIEKQGVVDADGQVLFIGESLDLAESSTEVARGFSTSTWQPRSKAAKAMGAWV
jgi:hypothetical protein